MADKKTIRNTSIGLGILGGTALTYFAIKKAKTTPPSTPPSTPGIITPPESEDLINQPPPPPSAEGLTESDKQWWRDIIVTFRWNNDYPYGNDISARPNGLIAAINFIQTNFDLDILGAPILTYINTPSVNLYLYDGPTSIYSKIPPEQLFHFAVSGNNKSALCYVTANKWLLIQKN